METENGFLNSSARGNRKTCLEFLTLLYIGIEILWQEYQMCSFAAHFPPIAQRIPLIEAFILTSGLVLTVANILFLTEWRNSRRVFFLYGICLLDALSSYMAIGSVKLVWIQQVEREIITVVLFYCAAQRVRENSSGRLLHLFYWICLLFWSMMCCLSLCQFALMIGSDGPRSTIFPLLQGRGYYGHRLFGVFNWPEYGAVTSLLIMLAGGYYFARTRSIAERGLLLLCNVPLLFYLVICRSRNAQAALYLCVFLGVGLVCLKRPLVPRGGRCKALTALAAALAVVAGAHLGYIAIQHTAEHVPGLFSEYSGPLVQKAVQSPSADMGEETQNGETATWSSVLERIDTKGNIGTNRLSIWKDYLSLWKEYGLFGLSSIYDLWYILEHHPELFICQYSPGSVYHPHNGYLKALSSTGYLGFTFLMLFLLGGVSDVWKAIQASEKIKPELLFPLLIVLAGCSSTMFDLELFFVFNPISYIFWLALGILMKQVSEKSETGTQCANADR